MVVDTRGIGLTDYGIIDRLRISVRCGPIHLYVVLVLVALLAVYDSMSDKLS